MPSYSDDSFFAQNHPTAPHPPHIPFALQKGDRLLLIGDSITEARRYTRMIETYLTVCQPDLQVEVRNIGKGGETAPGFLERIDTECLNFKPTAATICYGMNDMGFWDNYRAAVAPFQAASLQIVKKLKAAGVRLVLSSPGCIGMLPPWPVITERNDTLDGLNASLMYLRDAAAAIAIDEKLPFVDHFWDLYSARLAATRQFGSEYAVCGMDDGVHPSWAGHLVMAYSFFKTLGFDGCLGDFTIGLAAKTAAAGPGHTFKAEAEGSYTFTSARYPFCAEGPIDKDWSIRSGMALAPFNREFNRMTLKVTGAAAPRYRVAWMDHQFHFEEYHTYSAAQLAAGVNLAEDFQLNPFSAAFRRVDDLIFQKQTIETEETWHTWEGEGKSAAGMAEYESRRAGLREAVRHACVPVTHNIRIVEY
jgi:lysophospholipase L1-like esterase